MTAKPGSQKVYIYRGDPWEMTIGPSSLDEVIPDVNTILAQVRASEDDATVIVDLAANAVLSGDDKVVTLSLTPDETAALTPGTFVWDFQPDPDEETWFKGAVVIEGDVSRPEVS